ncbi:Fic family protein [uncultured Halopseudomonas sp.]|uniref:Fic family protein n=1 Tax=uncultured Halopseudomonas sp. TaxID=2901193 RepID=UPI0030EE4D63
MGDLVGYAWIQQTFGIELCQPLVTVSTIGPSRKTIETDSATSETYQSHYKPEDTLSGHLTFALKREPLSLELLSRLFNLLDPAQLIAWIHAEPTGQYARRACFLYEWLTDRELDHPGVTQGNYVSLLDDKRYLLASSVTKNPRWRINDNLPGDRYFCPIVRKTDPIKSIESYDIASAIDDLGAEFGQEILLKSAVWLTIRESRSSFAIEHEQNETDRIRRFASVMEDQCGRLDDPFLPATLVSLQKEILGPNSLSYGVRRSPVMVGETRAYDNIIHYLAPHWDDLPRMLQGLAAFEHKTRGQSPLLRAAVLSFGFVYIHPMSDGNGRISRFFINDCLRRDGALAYPYILPASVVMQDKSFRPLNYDQALEVFSRPLMRAIRNDIHSDPGNTMYGADGIPYDIQFSRYVETNSAWRYIDLTRQTEYLGKVIKQTIESEMRAEAKTLKSHATVRLEIKSIIEGPDAVIDRIIRSIRQSNGVVSNKLRKEYPLLEDVEIASSVIEAVKRHMPW